MDCTSGSLPFTTMIFSKAFLKATAPGFDASPDWLVAKYHPECETIHQPRQYFGLHSKSPPLLPLLPTELWELIFTYTLPLAPQSRIDKTTCPFLLLQVCSAWRAFVLASPRIWAILPTLQTTAWHGRGRDEARLGTLVQVFLTQSTQAPFVSHSTLTSLCIQNETLSNSTSNLPSTVTLAIPQFTLIAGSEYQAYRSPSSRLTPVWDIVLPFFTRLKNVRLQLPETGIIPLLGYQLPDDSVLLLESLTIEVHPEALPSTTHLFSLKNAPRLQRVALSHITFNIRTLSIPFSQLIELIIVPQAWAKPEVFLTFDECVGILGVAKDLAKMEMVVEDVEMYNSDRVHSSVEQMNISIRDSDRAITPISRRQERLARFFDALQMASLRRLTIGNSATNSSATDTWPFQAFDSFLARSATFLTHLHLVNSPMREMQLVDCIRRATQLKTLIIEGRAVADIHDNSTGNALLSALTARDDTSLLLPYLEVLELRHCGKEFTPNVLANMLDSRLKVGLKRFIADVSFMELSEEVKLWKENGLLVELTRPVIVESVVRV